MSSNFLDKTGLSYLWSKITALIPSKLPNPQKLTVNGTEYDGSTAVTVTISGGGGVTMAEVQAQGYQTAAQVQSAISTALGEVENGSY